MPFAWGREANDCVSFALGAVEAMTGRYDLYRAMPDWTSQRGARRALNRLGGLEAAVDGVLTPVPLAMAARGDVALVRFPGQDAEALMIVEGETLVGPGASGARRVRRVMMVRAWSAE